MQGTGGARVGKLKKGGKRREVARGRKEKREGGKGKGEREGVTRHTNPSLLPAPLSTPPLDFTGRSNNAKFGLDFEHQCRI